MKQLAVVFCVLFLGAALWSLFVEARPYFVERTNNDRRLQDVFDSSNAPGFSLSSSRVVLDECVWAMTSLYGTLQAADRRSAAAESCANQATGIISNRPSFSYAFATRALAAKLRNDIATLSDDLVTSQRLAPTTQWLASARVRIASESEDALSNEALASEDADLALLVRSEAGIGEIAARYVSDAAFRDRITAIVDNLPDSDKRRFVTRVKQAVAKLTVGAR